MGRDKQLGLCKNLLFNIIYIIENIGLKKHNKNVILPTISLKSSFVTL